MYVSRCRATDMDVLFINEYELDKAHGLPVQNSGKNTELERRCATLAEKMQRSGGNELNLVQGGTIEADTQARLSKAQEGTV